VLFRFRLLPEPRVLQPEPPRRGGRRAGVAAKRLFDARLELIAALEGRSEIELARAVREPAEIYGDPKTDAEVRHAVVARLQGEVAAMNLDNFVVRPHRRLVEKYAQPEAWATLAAEAIAELSREVAGLPSALDPENEEAKRFDLLALSLQIARLRAQPGFERLRPPRTRWRGSRPGRL
jgi:type I restriction enzyme R subunit